MSVDDSDVFIDVDQAQQRELTVRHVKETEKELNRNFQLQKEQYEATIQRHLAFIDQVQTHNLISSAKHQNSSFPSLWCKIQDFCRVLKSLN